MYDVHHIWSFEIGKEWFRIMNVHIIGMMTNMIRMMTNRIRMMTNLILILTNIFDMITKFKLRP